MVRKKGLETILDMRGSSINWPNNKKFRNLTRVWNLWESSQKKSSPHYNRSLLFSQPFQKFFFIKILKQALIRDRIKTLLIAFWSICYFSTLQQTDSLQWKWKKWKFCWGQRWKKNFRKWNYLNPIQVWSINLFQSGGYQNADVSLFLAGFALI